MIRGSFKIFGLAILIIASDVHARFNFPCTTLKYTRGSCVNIYSCPEVLNLQEENPFALFTHKIMWRSQCGFNTNEEKVCCEMEEKLSLPPSQRFPINIEPREATDESYHKNIRLLDQINCGPENRDKIYGGSSTSVNEFPWMALVSASVNGGRPQFHCGGSIINHRYILTAAHCVKNDEQNLRPVGVRVGEHNLKTEVDCDTFNQVCAEKYQDFLVEKAYYHPNYNQYTFENDIALIRVDRNIDFRPDNAKPICLPFGSTSNIMLNKLVVSGWGFTERGNYMSPVLLKASLPILQTERCIKEYSQTVSNNQICVGGEEGKSTCSGDSGSPLQGPAFYNGSTRIFQYGIVSFGSRDGCALDNIPVVFTRVSSYLNWILANMRD